MNTTAATATKSNGIVTLVLPDGETHVFKGKRAANAAAIVVGQWNHDGSWYCSISGSIANAHKHLRSQSRPSFAGGIYLTNGQVIVF